MEQFGLQERRHFADFIEQDGSLVAQLELARFRVSRPGEGSRLVSKKFALQQFTGHGRAVDLEKGAVRARRKLVNQPGQDFLARAAFAE